MSLFEDDPYPVGAPPDHAAPAARTSVVEGQLKCSRDAGRAGNVQTGATVGQIANDAIYRQRMSIENDPGALEDARPLDPPLFLHADFCRCHWGSMPEIE